MVLFGGFYLNTETIPVYVRCFLWFNGCSLFGYIGLASLYKHSISHFHNLALWI